MLRSQRLASTAMTLLFRFKLTDPAPDGTFAKLHVFTDLADAQALGFDHLSYLELETCVKGSSGFWGIHCCRHLGFKNLSLCLFKLDHHMTSRSEVPQAGGNPLRATPDAAFPLLKIKDRRPGKSAIEYTYPQLLIQNSATRLGSLLDRQGGSIFNRRRQAKLNGHDPYAYLKDVLTRLPTQRASQVAELLPHRWQPSLKNQG